MRLISLFGGILEFKEFEYIEVSEKENLEETGCSRFKICSEEITGVFG